MRIRRCYCVASNLQTCLQKVKFSFFGSALLEKRVYSSIWRFLFKQLKLISFHFLEDQLPDITDREPTPYRKALFKKMREQERAAFFNTVLQRGRQDAAEAFQRPRAEVEDPLAMPIRNPRPRPHPRPRNYDPLQFDPLQNFNENFYGQEVYRPRNPNSYVPNAPIIYPHNHDDPLRVPRQPHNPDMPARGPFGTGRRHNPNQFI